MERQAVSQLVFALDISSWHNPLILRLSIKHSLKIDFGESKHDGDTSKVGPYIVTGHASAISHAGHAGHASMAPPFDMKCPQLSNCLGTARSMSAHQVVLAEKRTMLFLCKAQQHHRDLSFRNLVLARHQMMSRLNAPTANLLFASFTKTVVAEDARRATIAARLISANIQLDCLSLLPTNDDWLFDFTVQDKHRTSTLSSLLASSI
nr:hypothetical protein CFP56_71879 [Quercus suber]